MTEASEEIADLRSELARSRKSNDDLKGRMVVQGLLMALLYIPLVSLAVYLAVRLALRRGSL